MITFLLISFSRGVGILLAYFFVVFITNKLSTYNAGNFFLGINLLVFLVRVSVFGQEQLIVKFASSFFYQNKEKSSRINLTPFIMIVVCFSCVSYLLVFFGTQYFFYDLFKEASIVWTLSAILPISFLWVFAGLLKSLGNQGWANFVETGLIPLLFLIAASFIDQGLALYTKVYFFASVMALFLVYFFVKNKIKLVIFDGFFLKRNMRIGKSIAISSVANYSIITLPIVLTGFLHNITEVALLNVSLKISLIIATGITIFNSIASPLFAEMYSAKQFIKLKNYYFLIRKQLVVVALIPSLILMFYAYEVLLIFGDDYVVAVDILRIMIVAQVISCITGTTGAFLMMTGNEKKFRNNALLSLFFTLTIGSWLVFSFGLIGIAIAISLGIVVENILSYLSVKRVLFALCDQAHTLSCTKQ